MKKIVLLTFVLSFLCVKEASARRSIVPYCSSCEYIDVVGELPDTAAFYSEEYKQFVDVGYMYKQFWIIWVPIWNYDGKYVLTIKDQDVFFDLSETELAAYKEKYNLNLPENPISFWNKIGGKLVIGLLLVLIVVFVLLPGKKEEQETTH